MAVEAAGLRPAGRVCVRVSVFVGGAREAKNAERGTHAPHALAHASRDPRPGLLSGREFPDKPYLAAGVVFTRFHLSLRSWRR